MTMSCLIHKNESEVNVYQPPFMFVNDWNLSYNGKTLNISQKDLENYYENGLTDDEIKSIAFSYLSRQAFFDFEKPNGSEDEL
jgi:hypothetical protein